MVKRILNEVVILAGALIAAGESGASLVPAGMVGTPLQIVLTAVIPFVVTLVARQHTIPLHKRKDGSMADLTGLNQALAEAQNVVNALTTELQAAKAAATPQQDVDAATAAVQGLSASLRSLITPPPAA